MSNQHPDLAEGQIHKVNNFSDSDITGLEARTFAAGDIGKVVKVSESDFNSYWLVVDNSGPIIAHIEAPYYYHLQTADATVTTIATLPINDEESYLVRAKAICQVDGTNSDRATITKSGFFYRTGGGNIVQEGSTTTGTNIKSSGFSGVDISFSISGTNLLVRVTGKAATDINWKVFINRNKTF